MADLQLTQEILVEIPRFYNVDLFQRGYFQVRLTLKQPPKLFTLIECENKEVPPGHLVDGALFNAFVEKSTNTAVSKTFEIYYRHEEVIINDVFLFRMHMLLDSAKVEEQFPGYLEFSLDLHFAECTASPSSGKVLQHACNQVLRLHQSFTDALHYHRPVLFDYFHLGSVSLTLHSSVVAMRQPWLGSLTNLHPSWNVKSSSKQILYAGLFGKTQPMHTDQKVSMKQHRLATDSHRKMCHSLLKMYESVLFYFHHAMSWLPDHAQMRISQPDIQSKLDVLSNEFCNMTTTREMVTRLGDDLYLLSTELTMLWGQFVEQFMLAGFLSDELQVSHHNDRMRHLAEAFFVRDHGWGALHSRDDLSVSQHSSMANAVKSSRYYRLIDPMQLECGNLDGDMGGTPIIFEDRFIPGSCVYQDNALELSVEENLVGDFVDLDVSVHELSDTKDGDSSSLNAPLLDRFKSQASPCTTRLAWQIDDEEDSPQLSSNPLTEQFATDSSVYADDRLDPVNTINSPVSALTVSPDDAFQKFLRHPAETDLSGNATTSLSEVEIEIPNESRHTFVSYDDRENNRPVIPPIGTLHGYDSGLSPDVVKNGGLMTCFPPMSKGGRKHSKSGSKKTMLSPIYSAKPEALMSRFEKAKKNLKLSLNYPGQFYSDIINPLETKPYFTERILSSSENSHLVICVHGLDGNSGDLRLVKCYLELSLPAGNFDFLMSEVNQDDTFSDIDTLTDNLCKEIVHYIEMNRLNPTRISFVGHSLGNIIIRNAVVNFQLMPYRGKFYTFLSLSGPHLGMLYHTSSLVSTGMWLMKKWKKEGSILQLSLADSSDPTDSFMYRLSLTNGFQYFRNVLLVGSVQDHYVPFHSARLESCKQAVKDTSIYGKVYEEMLNNILKPLEVQEEINFIRYSVYHSIPSSANSFIGRAAHIAMLDSELFIEKLILVSAFKYFK